jgi:hypothetical protein
MSFYHFLFPVKHFDANCQRVATFWLLSLGACFSPLDTWLLPLDTSYLILATLLLLASCLLLLGFYIFLLALVSGFFLLILAT